MNKNQLQERLIQEHIPQRDYSFTDEFPNEAFCLRYDKKGRVWEVYYGEYGIKTGLKCFNVEEEACDYFYNWLIKTLKRHRII